MFEISSSPRLQVVPTFPSPQCLPAGRQGEREGVRGKSGLLPLYETVITHFKKNKGSKALLFFLISK